jgi:hypothetical protein
MKTIKEYQDLNDELSKKVQELEALSHNDKNLEDSTDTGLLVVENESMKRKIKMLEQKVQDQSANEKVAQKLESKDFEIRNLKNKIEKGDKEIVALLERA